jgi:hypothetical protein
VLRKKNAARSRWRRTSEPRCVLLQKFARGLRLDDGRRRKALEALRAQELWKM